MREIKGKKLKITDSKLKQRCRKSKGKDAKERE